MASEFFIINCNSRRIKTKSNHFSHREGFSNGYSNLDQDCTRGKHVASTAITTTSTTAVVNTIILSQVQPVKSTPFLIFQKYIGSLKKTSVASKERKKNQQESWKTSLATDKNQYIYSCDRLFAKPTLVYVFMASTILFYAPTWLMAFNLEKYVKSF